MAKRTVGNHCQFDSRPLKIKNRPNFLTCRWHATHFWKAFDKGYSLKLHFNQRSFTQNYGPPKLQESQLWEFRDSHLEILGQNDIWVLVLWPSTEYTIRGKAVASPKSKSWWVLWVLWVRVCPWFVRAPKRSNYALTNLLFGLCRSVWVIEFFVNLPSTIPKL
jgi:hypothetical protein